MQTYFYQGKFYYQPIDLIPAPARLLTREEVIAHRTKAHEGYSWTYNPDTDWLDYYKKEAQQDPVIQAKNLLRATHHFETDSHLERFFTAEEAQEFLSWRHDLIDVIIDDGELPTTPQFITDLLEEYHGL